MNTPVTVIATTYNQSRDLALYLKSLTMQTHGNFELIIADDGSRNETRDIIQRFKKDFFGDRLKHLWQEDLGYRKSKILNTAIRASLNSWLIFTDSDLLLHPRFVEDHVTMAAKNTVFMGRRIDLSPITSDWVRAHEDCLFSSQFYYQIAKSILFEKPMGKHLKRALRISNPTLARTLGCFKVPDLLGSNFSIDRELLYRVNGFDESSEHYWGEDGDLYIRLRNSGARMLGRKSFAVQFHLWHTLRKPQKNAELNYQQKLVDRKYLQCSHGLTPKSLNP